MANDPGYDAPPPKKSNTLLWVLGGIFGGLTVFCCLPCGGCIGFVQYTNYKSDQRVANEPGITVTADDLAKNYSDSVYKDKVLVITGKVNDQSALGLNMGSGTTKVLCTQSQGAAAEFAKITAGETVTVKGICGGKLGDTIMVTNCQKK